MIKPVDALIISFHRSAWLEVPLQIFFLFLLFFAKYYLLYVSSQTIVYMCNRKISTLKQPAVSRNRRSPWSPSFLLQKGIKDNNDGDDDDRTDAIELNSQKRECIEVQAGLAPFLSECV